MLGLERGWAYHDLQPFLQPLTPVSIRVDTLVVQNYYLIKLDYLGWRAREEITIMYRLRLGAFLSAETGFPLGSIP